MPGGPGGDEADPGQVDALAEDDGQEVTVAHVHGAGAQQVGDGRWRHGGYLLLSGRVDGRSAVARRMRTLGERIARDAGYDTFQAMPVVRQAAVTQFCRTVAA